jgi:hypothetical protein
MYEELIDRLTLHFTNDPYRAEVAAAKKEFFDEAGIMDEESQFFEMRMTQFLEWYLFTRPLSLAIGAGRVTPAVRALEIEEFVMTADERPAFESLACIRHSLFEFVRIRGEEIHIHDLLLDKPIVIYGSPIRIGFSRDEIFDARLIPDGEQFHFSRAFCFHPAEASRYILAEIKKLRKSKNTSDEETFMLKAIKMRYKYEQYRHLKLDYVYTNEKKVRF